MYANVLYIFQVVLLFCLVNFVICDEEYTYVKSYNQNVKQVDSHDIVDNHNTYYGKLLQYYYLHRSIL